MSNTDDVMSPSRSAEESVQTSGFMQVVGQTPYPTTTGMTTTRTSQGNGLYFQPPPQPCPTCGRCPTCGHGGHQAQPNWNGYPNIVYSNTAR